MSDGGEIVERSMRGIPEHFPALHFLAGELHAYAELFDRDDLLVDLPTGGRRSLQPQVFDEAEVRRKLEQQRLVPNDRDRIVNSYEPSRSARWSQSTSSTVTSIALDTTTTC